MNTIEEAYSLADELDESDILAISGPYRYVMAKYQILSEEDEVELLAVLKDEKAEEQSKSDARDALVLHNIRAVLNIALGYQNCGLDLEDLVQEGILGLMTAIDKYDNSNGNRLLTYGVWWIKQSIARAIATYGRVVRFPEYIPTQKVARVRDRIYKMTDKHPSIDELAEVVGCTRQQVWYALAKMEDTVYLDEPVLPNPGGEAAPMMDYLESGVDVEQEASNNVFCEQLNGVIGGILSRRDHQILRDKVVDEKTLADTGKGHHISHERVRQILLKVICKLRRSSKLCDYHDEYYNE